MWHVHIAYYHCAKNQIENQTPKVLISQFKYILYDYFHSIIYMYKFLKRRLLKIATPPVLRTCGNDNSKSRYGDDLIFVWRF